MKKMLGSRIFWGIAVIIGGVMALLDNLNVIDFGEVFWAVIAFLGAIFFLSIYLQKRTHWWALVPGISLIGIGLTILVNWQVPEFGEVWGGAILLGGIGLSFFFLYLVDHENWWAIIPAGIMVSIGIAAGIEQTYGDRFGLGLFFLGMGLTFALLPLLPTPPGKMGWAWATALILAALGAIFMFTTGEKLSYLGPLVLIVIGIALVIKSLVGSRQVVQNQGNI
jgi:hypothetical protein